MPSVTIGTPPASSIFIAIDVPERGRPDTTTIGAPRRSRRKKRIMVSGIDYELIINIMTIRRGPVISRLALTALVLLVLPARADAYIGPGAGFAVLGSFLVIFTTILIAIAS